jgi:hypothetical protein
MKTQIWAEDKNKFQEHSPAFISHLSCYFMSRLMNPDSNREFVSSENYAETQYFFSLILQTNCLSDHAERNKETKKICYNHNHT